MSSKNAWKPLRHVQFFEWYAQQFIRVELELALTFVQIAHTKYLMGNIGGGDVSRGNAERAYREALKYFGKLSAISATEYWKLMVMLSEVMEAIATLPKPANA